MILGKSRNTATSPFNFETKYRFFLSYATNYVRILKWNPFESSIKQVHAQMIINGFSQDSFLATHLVKSYAKAGDNLKSRLVFESVHKKDVFLWNAMIRSCSRIGYWDDIVSLYGRMIKEGTEPDCYTLPFVIRAISAVSTIEEGKRIHELAKTSGLVKNVYVASVLIEMYLKFDEIDIGRKVFEEIYERDVVLWTNMISGYINIGDCKEALNIFREMRLGDVRPNSVTILTLIPACNYTIHVYVIKSGLEFSVELQTAIVDMYAKGGHIKAARCLFNEIKKKSLISWSTMVNGYSQNGDGYEALSLFHRMVVVDGLKPDFVIISSVLQACVLLSSLSYGETIHAQVVREGMESEILLGTTLIDMYGKCGSIISAEKVFHQMNERNVITWSTMVMVYGIHGLATKAFNLFNQLKNEGLDPDETVFLNVLSACSHGGLVNEGKECFALMVEYYNLKPERKHYACMVDLLCRAGFIEEAKTLILEMPFEPDENVYGALLSSCRSKGKVEIAEFACSKLIELQPSMHSDYFPLLANVYAECGRWDQVSKVRSCMKRIKEKTPGWSSIEVSSTIHTFFAGHSSHPQSTSIIAMLKIIHEFAYVNGGSGCEEEMNQEVHAIY